MEYRLAIDSGGTFTDICLLSPTGSIRVLKVPSTPKDPSEAIAQGMRTIIELEGIKADEIGYFGHGTTVATNALLEGHGAETGLITTDGFKDLLEIGRQQRPHLYDFQADKPIPLVSRANRLEVLERVLPDGQVIQELDVVGVRRSILQLKDAGVEAIAVCFLYSYLYPDHEQQVAKIIEEDFPDAYVSLSHEVLPEFREYERLSTTTVNCFVGPLMSTYVTKLRQRVKESGLVVSPYITQSNGGVISVNAAAELPVRTVLSGPAAGVIGAAFLGLTIKQDQLITFDMGGTSTDIALINGHPEIASTQQDIAGYPIRVPMLDIRTVGAGGGSIAWIDSGGHLKVGPESAGADPGPACYGRRNGVATVTDANVVLGILNQEALLNGQMPIDASASVTAMDSLADELSLSREEVAQGILDIATANMARAVRVISVERGHDPRDYSLVAFGGAGPLHATRLARELEIPKIIIPTIPGLMCAFGLLVADLRTDFSQTNVMSATHDSMKEISTIFRSLEESATTWFHTEGIAPENRATRRIADMRYVGQNFELSIPLGSDDASRDSFEQILSDFHEAHDRTYGFASPTEPIQFVTFRLEASGKVYKPEISRLEDLDNEHVSPVSYRKTFLPESGGWSDVPLFNRDSLGTRFAADGPLIIEQMDTTSLVLPGQHAEIDAFGNIVIREIQ